MGIGRTAGPLAPGSATAMRLTASPKAATPAPGPIETDFDGLLLLSSGVLVLDFLPDDAHNT